MSNQQPGIHHLCRTWLHSYEEDTETELEYRPETPENFAFPPSRGRTGFTFLPNGNRRRATAPWLLDTRRIQVDLLSII